MNLTRTKAIIFIVVVDVDVDVGMVVGACYTSAMDAAFCDEA